MPQSDAHRATPHLASQQREDEARDLGSLTHAELDAYAARSGVSFSSDSLRKDEKVSEIRAHLEGSGGPSSATLAGPLSDEEPEATE